MVGRQALSRSVPRSVARLAIASLAVSAALVLAGSSLIRPSEAATTIAGSFTTPRVDGITVGFAGTNDPQALVAAQPFEVKSLAVFHVATQSWRTYVPGAPAFAQTLTPLTLRTDSIVWAKRSSSTALNSSPIPIAGPPLIEFADQPQRFEVPPGDGLTLGISGTTIPQALAASQFFNSSSMNVWNIGRQRYLTYIPGAPERVNTLTAANLQVTDIVWLKALGGATGGSLLVGTPFVARLVPFGEAGTLIGLGTPLHGELIDNGDGSVTYIPEDNFNGDDSFTYTVMTPDGPEVRTFRLEVLPENDPPIAHDDIAIAEGGDAIVIAVLENDEDADDDPLSILRTTQPANGVVAIAGNAILYTPTPKFIGVDTFTYEVTDGIADPGDEDAIATGSRSWWSRASQRPRWALRRTTATARSPTHRPRCAVVRTRSPTRSPTQTASSKAPP